MSDLTARHELRDVNVRGLLLCAGVLVASMVVSFLVSWWAFDAMSALDLGHKQSAFPLASRERGQLPAAPRLEEIDRLEDLKKGVPPNQLQAAQQRLLTTYGWVDEKAGIARIPISRAMKMLVEQKRLPSRPEEARPAEGMAGHRRPSAANSGRSAWKEEP